MGGVVTCLPPHRGTFLTDSPPPQGLDLITSQHPPLPMPPQECYSFEPWAKFFSSTNLLHFVFLFTTPVTVDVCCAFYTSFSSSALWEQGSYFVHLCFLSDLHMGNKEVFKCIFLISITHDLLFNGFLIILFLLFMCISERSWQDVSEWALPGVGTFGESPWIQVLFLSFEVKNLNFTSQSTGGQLLFTTKFTNRPSSICIYVHVLKMIHIHMLNIPN